MMINVGDTTKYVYFVLTQSTDHISRKTGTLTNVNSYYSLNGGAATEVLVQIVEVSAAYMPGVYKVAINSENMVAAAGELCLTISADGVDPETRTIAIVKPTADSVLDEVIISSNHIECETVGKMLREIHALLLNKQVVTETGMTTYDTDGATIVASHTLQDTGTSVTKTRTA